MTKVGDGQTTMYALCHGTPSNHSACLSLAKHITVAVFGFLTIIGVTACLLKIRRANPSERFSVRVMVLFVAWVQCFLLVVTGIVVFTSDTRQGVMGGLEQFAKSLLIFQFIVICYFFTHLACRYLKRDAIFRLYGRGSFLLICLVLLALMIYGEVERGLDIEHGNCQDPVWISYDVFGLVITSIFLCSGLFIWRRLNTVVKTRPLRNQKKRQLWILLVASFVTNLVSSIFDFSVWSDPTICSEFADSSASVAPVVITQRILGQLPPVWVFIVVFWSWQRADVPRDSESGLSSVENSSRSRKGGQGAALSTPLLGSQGSGSALPRSQPILASGVQPTACLSTNEGKLGNKQHSQSGLLLASLASRQLASPTSLVSSYHTTSTLMGSASNSNSTDRTDVEGSGAGAERRA